MGEPKKNFDDTKVARNLSGLLAAGWYSQPVTLARVASEKITSIGYKLGVKERAKRSKKKRADKRVADNEVTYESIGHR